MQRHTKPLPWRAKGISDTLDGSTAFTGAMMSLSNLIPDPSTANLWQCRPAAQVIANFGGAFSSGFSSGFSTGFFGGLPAGFISCFKVVGNLVYGMAADPQVPGYDGPFCFNLMTLQTVPVTGTQNATTLPTSPPTTGTWIPPQMDVIGSKLMVAHSGFSGVAGNYIGWFDLTTPTAPVWNAGTLTTVGGGSTFTVAPIAVAQFSGRAYYIHNLMQQPAVLFSDPLSPTTFTSVAASTNVLTFNDNEQLTAFGKLPLNNQLGGIIQALMVFKDQSNIFQITGDPLTGNLSVNALNCACGTSAPNSIASTPKGIVFMAADGFRLIDFVAHVSDPIGNDGKGICVPFIYSVVPSRVCAACNASVVRISVQNGNAVGSPSQEFWYDFSRQIWSGPHTFPASLIQPYNQTFIMAPIGIVGSLWQSDFFQSSVSTFTENSVPLTWTWQTPLLPDTDQITNNEMHEGTLDLALQSTVGTVTVEALDQNGVEITSVTLSAAGSPTIWGAFIWGAAPWGGASSALAPFTLPWPEPIVFARMSISASGNSAGGFRIGALHMRYQMLKTLTNTAAAA